MKKVTITLEVDEHNVAGNPLPNSDILEWAEYCFEGAFHGMDEASPINGKILSIEVDEEQMIYLCLPTCTFYHNKGGCGSRDDTARYVHEGNHMLCPFCS